MLGCLTGLIVSTAILFIYHDPLLAYAGLIFLALSAGIYLLPEEHRGRWIRFPHDHPYFRLLRLANLLFLPLTFLFVMGGLWALWEHLYWLLLLLAGLRILPGLLLEGFLQGRRRLLMSQTPEVDSFSGIGKSPLCKAKGYVFETRTRRRRFSSVLYNVWLIDASPTRLFVPSMTEIRSVTESIREGARVSVVGPSTDDLGIAAIQPIACAVPPVDWKGPDEEWMDVVWRRMRKRRLAGALLGSGVYLVAIVALFWVVANLAEYLDALKAMVFLSLLSAAFFAFLSEKSYREGAFYEVKDYFEPKRHHLSAEKWEEKVERLRQLVQSGKMDGDYVRLLERGRGRS